MPNVRLSSQIARPLVVLIALLVALALVVPAGAKPREAVEIQFLNVSDWHGQLDPLSITGVGNVGGAAALSTYFKQERANNPNTITLTAGDAVGATPPLSGFFADRPTIEAMRLIGFQADTLGNHNFDAGLGRLQEQIDLAGAPGNPFTYISANLKNVDANLSGVAPFKIIEVGGVKVGVVGVTNPEAPTLVFPGNFGTIEITDPVPAANKARAAAKAAGAQVTVLLTHAGITGYDAAGNAVGPLIDLANTIGGFDIIFGDHTDFQYSGIHNNALVLENKSKGATYARTTLKVDPSNGRIIDRKVAFVVPLSGAVTPDPAIVNLLAPYRTQLAAAFDEQIGVATGIFPRGGNVERLAEVAIGNLITDAMRTRYNTQLALTNGGGIRAALPSSYAPLNTALRRTSAGYAAGPPYDLVIGDVFTVLPFGNSVVTRNVTGAQLWAALEHSVAPIPAANGRFAQISGFKFVYDSARSPGARVISVALSDGTPILPDATSYSLATNDFTNAGGDGYTMFADGQGVTREVMADVVLDYITAQGTISPTIEGRITKLP